MNKFEIQVNLILYKFFSYSLFLKVEVWDENLFCIIYCLILFIDFGKFVIFLKMLKSLFDYCNVKSWIM